MRFFEKCTRFVEEVERNTSALSEVEKFTQRPEMVRVREKIADRLRVPYSTITNGESGPEFQVLVWGSSNVFNHKHVCRA